MFNGLVVLSCVYLVMCVSYYGVCGGISCRWYITVCYSNYIVCPCWCFFLQYSLIRASMVSEQSGLYRGVYRYLSCVAIHILFHLQLSFHTS